MSDAADKSDVVGDFNALRQRLPKATRKANAHADYMAARIRTLLVPVSMPPDIRVDG
jgi:hypothetical protein